MTKHANVEVSGQTVKNMFDQTQMKGPGQTGNVWRPNTIKHCLVTIHFTVWTPCLVLFDRV